MQNNGVAYQVRTNAGRVLARCEDVDMAEGMADELEMHGFRTYVVFVEWDGQDWQALED